MRDIDRLLSAFDEELALLSVKPSPASRRFLSETAMRMRAALHDFYAKHKRPPYTVGELFSSGFSHPKFHDILLIENVSRHSEIDLDVPIDTFLRATQRQADSRQYVSPSTQWALRLVHAVYRCHDPVSRWKGSAKILTQRGFSEEQIRLVQTDRHVREAMRRLVRPFDA